MPEKRRVPWVLCFEQHRTDGLVWALRFGRRWYVAAHVEFRDIPTMDTEYRGPTAKQPRAVLRGHARKLFELPDHKLLVV